jgi:chorismate--pyruvate lyase
MFEHSVLLRREPSWRPPGKPFVPVSAPRSWLGEPRSLTARLRAGCRDGFNVVVLRQAWRKPFAGEAARLGAGRRRMLVREVMLRDGLTPLVLARTVIPPDSLRGPHCALARLGNRPLGEVLFARRGLRRCSLECCRLGSAAWLPSIAGLCGIRQEVWGRRSVYRVGDARLLVAEFFLPAALQLESVAGRIAAPGLPEAAGVAESACRRVAGVPA